MHTFVFLQMVRFYGILNNTMWPKSNTKKITVTLPSNLADALEQIAAQDRRTPDELLARQAQMLVQRRISPEGEILPDTQDHDGSLAKCANALLDWAIESGAQRVELPTEGHLPYVLPATGDARLANSQFVEPWLIKRFAQMANTEEGTLSFTQHGRPYRAKISIIQTVAGEKMRLTIEPG
jgi:hypothetical protein